MRVCTHTKTEHLSSSDTPGVYVKATHTQQQQPGRMDCRSSLRCRYTAHGRSSCLVSSSSLNRWLFLFYLGPLFSTFRGNTQLEFQLEKKWPNERTKGGLSLSLVCVSVSSLCVYLLRTHECVCLTYLHTWCSREREREKGYCRNFWRICFFIWKRRWPTFLVLGTYVRKSTKMCRKFASGFVRGRMREKLSCIIAVDISASSSRVPKLADRRRSVSRTHRSTGTKLLLLLLFKSWPIGSSTTL